MDQPPRIRLQPANLDAILIFQFDIIPKSRFVRVETYQTPISSADVVLVLAFSASHAQTLVLLRAMGAALIDLLRGKVDR